MYWLPHRFREQARSHILTVFVQEKGGVERATIASTFTPRGKVP